VFFGSTIDLLRYNEPEIAQLGIGRKFQKPTVFEHLSVFENLELALKTPKGVKASMFFKLDSRQSDHLAEVLHTIHLADSVRVQAGTLSHGQKQWLEIGMLLMQDPQLLLLDEPVAGMTDHETERTAELFLSLKGKHSLMVVEHDMGFIRTISDIVTVLCDGAVLAQGTLDQVQADERVIEVYLGR
jgi:urea transport system ATP-binding protein